MMLCLIQGQDQPDVEDIAASTEVVTTEPRFNPNLVDIKLKQLGTGNIYRPGDMVGIQIELTSQLAEDESVWLQWDHETADGDVIGYGRRVTISPNQPRPFWLYVPLSPSLQSDTLQIVRVRRLEDNQPTEDLGILRMEPGNTNARPVSRETGMLGVIGTQLAGLDAYERIPNFQPAVLIASEPTTVTSIPDTSRLPDRWMGLRPFEALVWTDAEVELSPPQEAAVLEWIRRGGHLIIILPQTGNPWSLGMGEDGPLGSVLPGAPGRAEEVPIKDILPDLIKHDPPAVPPGTIPVLFFRNGDINVAPENDGWISIWNLPEAGTVGIQRSIGRGQLTILGVDLTSNALRAVGMLRMPGTRFLTEIVPEADVFWNRILGRRSDTPSSRAVDELNEENGVVQTPGSTQTVGDNVILNEIEDAGVVGGTILLAFAVFLLYWLFAIPLCWAILKKKRMLQWSWFGFFAISLIFTAVAWVTVSMTRELNVKILHLTVLDHVHGEDLQQAQSWMSIFTPGYGNYDISLNGEPDSLLLPWEPEEINISGFPDKRQTLVDIAKESSRITIPSRATTTSIQADWRGSLEETEWGDMLRMDPSRPIQIIRNSMGDPLMLRGTIISNLPEALINPQILFVDELRNGPRQPDIKDGEPQLWVRPSQSGRLERNGWAWAINRPVEPGAEIILDNFTLDPTVDLERSLRLRYTAPIQSNMGDAFRPLGESGRQRALESLSFYHQLEPPDWIRSPEMDPAKNQRWSQRNRDWAKTTRVFGRELDLSAWLSRPALIVTGFMPASELPLPLLIDGNNVDESNGLVMVRWIYPLPDESGPATLSPTQTPDSVNSSPNDMPGDTPSG
ncbi:MAG: hypothetical protein CMJ39_05255 [Phycisphaerae bacterium]|nr:hypothetical protein [Phycisphaerae bacterium]